MVVVNCPWHDKETGMCGCNGSYSVTKHEKNTKPRAPRVNPITLDLDKRKFIGITKEMVNGWQIDYPTVDVVQMLRSMVSYYMLNPQKMKTDWNKTIFNRLERSLQYNLYPRKITSETTVRPPKDHMLKCSICGGVYKSSEQVCVCMRNKSTQEPQTIKMVKEILGGKIIP